MHNRSRNSGQDGTQKLDQEFDRNCCQTICRFMFVCLYICVCLTLFSAPPVNRSVYLAAYTLCRETWQSHRQIAKADMQRLPLLLLTGHCSQATVRTPHSSAWLSVCLPASLGYPRQAPTRVGRQTCTRHAGRQAGRQADRQSDRHGDSRQPESWQAGTR
jgi:hypothetical protein